MSSRRSGQIPVEPLADLTGLAVDPERGPCSAAAHDAPATLLEYGDYQCPYCGDAEIAITDLLRDCEHDVRDVWRHLPLTDTTRTRSSQPKGRRGR